MQIHFNSNIVKLVQSELVNYGIKKYSFVKSYDEIERIEDKILYNNKDNLEWIEIIRNGTKYTVRVEERIINDNNTSLSNNDFYLLHKGDNIKITVDSNDDNNIKDYNISLYSINYDKYKSFVDTINNNKFEITNYLSDSNFIGKVNVDEDNTLLYTSISADNGWNVFVDGKKTSYIKIYDAVIGLELPDGEHEIEFKYTTPGLKQGLFVSLFTLLIVISINIVNKKNKEFD